MCVFVRERWGKEKGGREIRIQEYCLHPFSIAYFRVTLDSSLLA